MTSTPTQQYGVPKPGQPSYFLFSDATAVDHLDLTGAPFAGPASWITAQLLGLPTGPVDVDDFCRVRPTGDLPTAEDYALLAFPVVAWAGGAYQRFHNQIFQSEWALRCNATSVPGETRPGGGPIGEATICKQNPGAEESLYVSDVMPPGLASFSVHILDRQWSTDPPFADMWKYVTVKLDRSSTLGPLYDWEEEFYGHNFYDDESDRVDTWDPAIDQPWRARIGFNANVPVGSCITFRWDWSAKVKGTPVPKPSPPEAPTGMPARPDCPPIESLQDLGDEVCGMRQLLDNMNSKLDALLSLHQPPEADPDPEPTPAPPGESIAKPAGAIGCVVHFTMIPPKYAQYGNPGYFPGIGHAFMVTDSGPLASVELKHNPQVLYFPNPLVKSVKLDLSADVTATITYLTPPK